MREIVGVWISNLAVIAILAALVDMVLPNGSFRKYTSFVFGLVILVLFLQPLLKLTGQLPNLEKEVFQGSLIQQRDMLFLQKEQITETHQKQLEQTFRRNLEEELALELKHKLDLKAPQVSIVFGTRDGETDYANIASIEITSSEGSISTSIQPVTIGVGKDHNENMDREMDDNQTDMEEVQRIQNHVAERYDLDPGLVIVKLH